MLAWWNGFIFASLFPLFVRRDSANIAKNHFRGQFILHSCSERKKKKSERFLFRWGEIIWFICQHAFSSFAWVNLWTWTRLKKENGISFIYRPCQGYMIILLADLICSLFVVCARHTSIHPSIYPTSTACSLVKNVLLAKQLIVWWRKIFNFFISALGTSVGKVWKYVWWVGCRYARGRENADHNRRSSVQRNLRGS